VGRNSMDMNLIINIVLGVILSVGGWFLRQMWDAVQNLKSDIQRIEIDLPTSYVRKSDLDARLDKIDDMLEKLFDRLNSKADK
jgi:chaperonin cofactor prefoldin